MPCTRASWARSTRGITRSNPATCRHPGRSPMQSRRSGSIAAASSRYASDRTQRAPDAPKDDPSPRRSAMSLQPSDTLLTGLNRDTLLRMLPKGGVGVEIGVNRGGYSKRILAVAAPKVLHLVDPWPTDRKDEYIRTYM